MARFSCVCLKVFSVHKKSRMSQLSKIEQKEKSLFCSLLQNIGSFGLGSLKYWVSLSQKKEWSILDILILSIKSLLSTKFLAGMKNGRLWMMIFVIRMENCSAQPPVFTILKLSLNIPSWEQQENAYSVPFYAAVHSNNYWANVAGRICYSDNIQFCYSSSTVWQSMYTNPLSMYFAKIVTVISWL